MVWRGLGARPGAELERMREASIRAGDEFVTG